MIFCYGCKYFQSTDKSPRWREEIICKRTGEQLPAYHPFENCPEFVDKKSGLKNRFEIQKVSEKAY